MAKIIRNSGALVDPQLVAEGDRTVAIYCKRRFSVIADASDIGRSGEWNRISRRKQSSLERDREE
jgi:hypothetical protein